MIKETLLNAIVEYCELNGIRDVEIFVNKLLLDGFNVEKFGSSPAYDTPKEAIKEIRVEVPIEKIVEVEKIVHVSDNTKIDELLGKIRQLEDDKNKTENNLKDRIEELEKNEILLKQALTKFKNIVPDSKKDIYGENVGDYKFGSNLMD